MVTAIREGRMEDAWELYRRFLPLIVFEQQPGIAIRKEIYRLRSTIEVDLLRQSFERLTDGEPPVSTTLRVQGRSLEILRQVAPRVAAISSTGGAAGHESLVVLVDRTGRMSGLGSSIRDQSPNGENSLRLRLEGASFDAMIGWLASLQQTNGVSVTDATIDAAAAPGLVNASITLTHGAATAQ